MSDATELDKRVHQAIVRLLDLDDEPYRLSIDHDTRSAKQWSGKPKTGACPLEYEDAYKGTVSISTRSRTKALDWIGKALASGYVVTRLRPTGREPLGAASLESIKRRLEYDKRPKVDDDEIPF